MEVVAVKPLIYFHFMSLCNTFKKLHDEKCPTKNSKHCLTSACIIRPIRRCRFYVHANHSHLNARLTYRASQLYLVRFPPNRLYNFSTFSLGNRPFDSARQMTKYFSMYCRVAYKRTWLFQWNINSGTLRGTSWVSQRKGPSKERLLIRYWRTEFFWSTTHSFGTWKEQLVYVIPHAAEAMKRYKIVKYCIWSRQLYTIHYR